LAVPPQALPVWHREDLGHEDRVTLFHRWHLGAILHRNIDACCNGQQKPYTIACAVLLQRHT